MKFKWSNLEKGQALIEYWPTFPAAVAVMIAASMIVPFLNGSYGRVADNLQGTGLCADAPVEEIPEIQTEASIYDHKIESISSVYDPDTNRTTVAFRVTSGSSPSISHWILGISREVADSIVQSSEAASWTDNDPTTGMQGLKFDIGYEGGDSGGGGGNGANTGNGKGGKNARSKMLNRSLRGYLAQTTSTTGEARIIVLTLTGEYRLGAITVTTKAGNDQVGSGTVTGPIAPVADESDAPAGNNVEGCE